MIRKTWLAVCAALLCLQAAGQARNRYEEVIPIEVRGGHTLVRATVAGVACDFVLDPSRGATVVVAGTPGLPIENGVAVLERLAVADNLFVQRIEAGVTDDAALARLGIAGILGRDIFKGAILTIDRAERYATLSAPYKPAYMPLRSRRTMPRELEQPLDSLLEKGVATFDFAHNTLYFEPHGALVKPEKPVSTVARQTTGEGPVVHLDREAFVREVFDFRSGDEWKYRGTMPCVIDFWATWCKPCLELDPVIGELAEKYRGRVRFYKVNVDEQKEIAAGYFGVAAIPLLIFIPVDGAPVKVLAASRDEIEANIEKLLGVVGACGEAK
jgi:thiol-disulfide isomerase/thioredoxin